MGENVVKILISNVYIYIYKYSIYVSSVYG